MLIILDIVPVVLDRRHNPEADTGTFELAYRQVIPKAPAYLGLSLCINGKRLIKKPKERKHEPRSVTPLVPPLPSCDAVPDPEEPVPAEYNGPIITDFLTWLNPYDSLPMNKDNIVVGPKDSLTVRQAVTVVKSSQSVKSNNKKRKTSALSFRTFRARRERNAEFKRRIVPHSCCRPEDNQALKYRTESASKAEKSRLDRSVGNKRCYIDPTEWERETASILRSTISVQNKIATRAEPVVTNVRQIKSGIVSSNHKPLLEPLSSRSLVDSANTIKKLSAIGKSISKLHDESRNKKSTRFSNICTSISPYCITITPPSDDSPYLKSRTKN